MPPNAAVICGMTMNMLNTPIPTPIRSGAMAPDSMAYGMLRMLPHARPMSTKLHVKLPAVSGVHQDIDRKPTPPRMRLTRWVHRRFNPRRDVQTDNTSANTMLLKPYTPIALETELAASLYAALFSAYSSTPSMGSGAPKTNSVKAGVAKDHMVKKANQLKNCTAPSLAITGGISRMNPRISPNPAPMPRLSSLSLRNASMSAGGFSCVVNTVTRMLVRNTKAPMAKET